MKKSKKNPGTDQFQVQPGERVYDAPKIELLEVTTEMGFATSGERFTTDQYKDTSFI